MRWTGLEPVRVASHAPQTCAYANSATTAFGVRRFVVLSFLSATRFIIRAYSCFVNTFFEVFYDFLINFRSACKDDLNRRHCKELLPLC